jgi:hypothetical protein
MEIDKKLIIKAIKNFLVIIGIIIIVESSNYLVSVGVFFMIWANNILYKNI